MSKVAEYATGIGLGIMVFGIGLNIMPVFWLGVAILIFGCFLS